MAKRMQTRYIGNVKLEFETEYSDTKVTMNDIYLCWIAEESIEEFYAQFVALFSKFII